MSVAIRQLLQQGSFEQALAALPDLRVLRNDPERLYLRGIAHAALGQRGDAQRCAERGAELEPNDPRFHLMLASLVQVDDPERAKRLYVHVISLNPNLPDAHTGLALLAVQRGEVEQAESQFRTALRAQADHTPSLLAYGRWLMSLTRTDEGLALINRVLRREPQNPDALALAGRALTTKGNAEFARKALDNALAIYPNHAEALLFSAQLRMGMNQLEPAALETGRLLQLRPNDPAALLLGAEIALRGGDQSSATTLLTRVLQNNPRHEQAILKLADLYAASNPGAAAGLLARSAHDMPKSAILWRALLGVLRNSGALAEALVQAQLWTQRVPEEPQAWAQVAFLAELFDQAELAVEAAGRALQAEPGSIEAGLVLARAAMRQKRPAQALDRISAISPVPASGAARHEVERLRARALLETGVIGEALAAARLAAESGTLDPMPIPLERNVGRLTGLPSIAEVAHPPIWFLIGTPGSGVDALGRFFAAQSDCLVLTDRFTFQPRQDLLTDIARWNSNAEGPLAIARSRYLRGIERLQVPAGTTIFDWLPQLDVRAFDVLRTLLPRARFLVVQRDPRDALVHAVLQAANGQRFADPVDQADAIAAQTIHLAQILATHGAPVISVGFEQLQSAPDTTIEKLALAMQREAFPAPAAINGTLVERGAYARYLPHGASEPLAGHLAAALARL
jgi:Tfp pilus assembly protein PilF